MSTKNPTRTIEYVFRRNSSSLFHIVYWQTRTTSSINSHESTSYLRSLPQLIKFPSILSFSQPILSSILSFTPPTISKSRPPTISSPSPRRKSQHDSTIAEQSNPINGSGFHSVTIVSTLLTDFNCNSIDFHHLHILIYTHSFDFQRVISTMNTIESLIDLLPFQLVHRLFKTTQIRSSSSMFELYSQQQRAIRGEPSNETMPEQCSYLFILIDLLLIYVRSYSAKLSDVQENREIHLRSYRLLSRLCHNLSSLCIDCVIVSDDINRLLRRVAFQKIILHLFHRTIPRQSSVDITDESNLDLSSDALSQELVHLLEEMIFLEHLITTTDADLFGQSLVNQTLFLSIILQYLKNLHWIENHRFIIDFIVRILPYCGSALKTIGIRVIEQICRNLCLIVHQDPQRKMKQRFK